MFKADHKLLRTSKGDQYRSSSETGVCWVYWAAFASQAPHVCRAQQLQTASAPPAGAVSLDADLKKSLQGTGLAFPMQRSLGVHASNLALRRRAVWSERDGFAKWASPRAGAVS